jgi:hypothetical protein
LALKLILPLNFAIDIVIEIEIAIVNLLCNFVTQII